MLITIAILWTTVRDFFAGGSPDFTRFEYNKRQLQQIRKHNIYSTTHARGWIAAGLGVSGGFD